MRFISTITAILLSLAIFACTGGGGSGNSHTPLGTLLVTVDRASDGSAIEGASVSVYDDKNLVVAKGTTDTFGEFECSLSPGSYYVKTAAQDFNPAPLSNQTAVPFEIIDGQTVTESVALETHPNAGNMGRLSGTVMTPAPDSDGVSDVLVIAEDSSQNLFASGITGPTGAYALFNLSPGNYTLSAYRSGYRQEAATTAINVASGGDYTQNTIEIGPHENADLSGQVTFLAITNGSVDITLIHPETDDTIPGLSTFNDANNNYRLESVPPGTFIAWASFRNDGYVMDPDYIFKFGLPQVTFTENASSQEQDFSVTGAVTITDPTNDADLVVPEEINAASPTFTWERYPSAKEYIIEVFDNNGNTIWGGFDDAGVVQHQQITANQTSVTFNFDGSATASLQNGQVYRWKIYADNDDALNIQTLISSSEDLMGLFKYIEN